jgi:hypothetical protein
MPTYLMQLRWTPWGYQNITTANARRAAARTAAQQNNVSVIHVIDTLQGPDWILSGLDTDVQNLKKVFDSQTNVSVTTMIYQIGGEPPR